MRACHPTAWRWPMLSADVSQLGVEMFEMLEDLFPICRSITGDGLRETLRQIDKIAPLVITEVPTGRRVFDWTIPREWNIRDAWVANAAGERVIDFQRS